MSAGEAPALPGRGVRVLVVDDESGLRTACRHLLSDDGYTVAEAERGEEALAKLDAFAPHVVVTDLRMPGMSGAELLVAIKQRRPSVEVIVVTAFGSVETAVDCLRQGAYHFLLKPIDPLDLLTQTVRRAAERHRMARRIEVLEEIGAEAGDEDGGMLGDSPPMQAARRLIDTAAGTDAPVLVLGESGTGKELVSRIVHARSSRAAKPFVAVNCAALQENLLESELFGYVRGAFSGAVNDKAGLMEAAHHGTLLLDEIGEMSPPLQAKLLRALEQGEIRRVGDVATRQVDVRVIAATNRNLAERVADGGFREDLFYRLNVFQVRLPPLRERGADVVALARRFLARFSAGRATHFTHAALDALTRHRWPGNVRELQNTVQYAVAVCPGDAIDVDHLPEAVTGSAPDTAGPTPFKDLLDLSFSEAKAAFSTSFERTYVRHRLEQADGNLSEAARLAGMDRSNFRRLARRAGLYDER